MKKSTTKSLRRRNQGRSDTIDQFPDEIISHIISFLSIDEAMRSNVISKRWESLWKHASRLDFDGRHMVKPLSQLENSSSEKVIFDPSKASQQHARQYDEIVNQVLNHHIGDLVSCRFIHFPQSLSIGLVEKWVEFVKLKNKFGDLSLECEKLINETVKTSFKPRIFSNLYSLELAGYALNSLASLAFESCEKLETLKLKKLHMNDKTINGILRNCPFLKKFSLTESTGFKKLKIRNSKLEVLELQWLVVSEIDIFVENLQVVVLNSMICPTKGLKIFAPNLRSFHSSYNVITQKMQSSRPHNARRMQARKPRQHVLNTQDILEKCSGLLGSQTMNIFRNLITLKIDLNLNNIREALPLSFILRSCLYLKNLEITIPVDRVSNSNDCTLPFPNSKFWEREGMSYNCINHKLKYATIRGFTSQEQEMKFAKFLITNANMMERMSIICDSSIIDEATSLQSLPKASVYLHDIKIEKSRVN